MKVAAKFISVIFHPLLIPVLGFLFMLNSGTYLAYSPYKKLILIVVGLDAVIMPLLIAVCFFFIVRIFSVEMKGNTERIFLLVITLILYIFCYYSLKKVGISHTYNSFWFASIITVLLSLLITIKWKISLHMVGLGGLAGLVGFLIFSMRINLEFYLIMTLIAAGLAGTSRLLLEAHKPPQLYAGFALGLFTIPVVMLVY